MEINRIIGVNCKNLNNVTFGCFGKRNNPTNDSVDFKTKNNVKKDNQSPQNFLDAIKGLFSSKSSANLDEDRKKEIENLQEKTKDIDAEKVRQYFDGERTVRTTTVKMNSSSKKIGNAEKVAKTTTATKNDYSHLPNQPKFSFDYDKLVEDLAEIDAQVDEKWVIENPDSAFNLIKAAAKGENIPKNLWEKGFPTDKSKVNFINNLIADKEKFIEEATKQHSFEKSEYINSIFELLNHHDNKVVNRVIDAVRKYGDSSDLERDAWTVPWDSDDENTLLNLIKTTVEIGKSGETNDASIFYIIERPDAYSEKLVMEALKAIQSLTPNGTGWYEDILKLINKLPNDKEGEFSKILLDTLKAVGDKKNVENLDKYLRNYNYVNQYMNKGENTPQIILDAIEDIRKTISEKEYAFVSKK